MVCAVALLPAGGWGVVSDFRHANIPSIRVERGHSREQRQASSLRSPQSREHSSALPNANPEQSRLTLTLPLLQRLPSDKPDDLSPLTDLNWVAAQLEVLADSPPQRTRRAPAQWPPAKSATEVGTLHPAMAGMSLRSPRVLAGPYESPGGSPPAAAEVAEALPIWEALGRRLEVLKLPIASA